MKKTALIGLVIVVLVAIGSWWLLSSSERATRDFPYVIKNGQVYCADGTPRYDGALVENADASTFRRPTQEERENALAHGPQFMIDAVDEDNSFYQCSWVNFSGTI